MSQPEFIQEIMEDDYGDRVLITDPTSNAHLEEAQKGKKLEKKFPQWFNKSNNN